MTPYVSSSVPKKVHDFVAGLHDVHKVVHENLVRANSKYKQDADHKQRHVDFEEGDFVLAILTKDRFPVGEYNKLSAKKIGPLEIVEKINSNAYRLKLPSHISTVKTSVMVFHAVENEGVEVNLCTSKSALGPKTFTRTSSEELPDHVLMSFRVPPSSCPSSGLFFLQVRFVFLSFILFTFPLSLHHMAFGSQTVGDAVVPKFDMHVYTSVLTSDEVKSLVAEYAIPLDLHPYVPPSSLTMNRLPADKIGIYDQYLDLSGVRVPFSTFLLSVIKHFRVHISQLVPLGLNRLTMFEIYCRSLEINPSVNLFRAFYKLNKHGHWFSFERRLRKGGQGKIFNEFCTSLKHWKDRFFLIDRRAIPDAMPWRHQDSSVADPAPTGVCAEDIRRLCENIIDLRPVHPAMLYAVGLTTIWKHVGHHLVFKDGEGTVSTSMSQFLKFRMARGVHVGKGTALSANKAIPQDTTSPLPFGTQIPEKFDHQKKKKTSPLSFALSDSEADLSNFSGSITHHSASPLNTIIPNEAELTTRGDGLILESVNRMKDDTEHHLDNVEDTTEVGSALLPVVHIVKPSLGVILTGAALVRSSLRGDIDLPAPFVLAWSLTTHSILNDAESCRDMMINLATPAVRDQQNRLSDYQALQRSWFELGRRALAQIDILWRYEALNKDYGELYESHRSCQGVSDRLTETQNQLLDTVRSRNQLSEDHKVLQQVHLGCVGKEADLTEKLAAMEKEMDDLLEKDREREERIKQLEADLASKTSSLTEAEGAVSTLKGDLERLTVDLSHAEIFRHNYVRWLLPTVFQRLLSSDEYKKSLSDVFNLVVAAGWSEGVKAACSEEEAKAFLATAADYDPACKGPTHLNMGTKYPFLKSTPSSRTY
ncbi:hypothetical protein Tco_0752661 [Tanacetum coccineum]|uniref:Transposase (Putative), gypsy type n=1 Tax=Tanacetum coccineum TaxID=301880 RepID=A0ABQ4Z8H5_9ASTR